MIELAKNKMTADNKAGFKGNYDEIYDRIGKVYYLGYVYDPYKDNFWNAFFDTKLLSNDIYTFDAKKLEEIHYNNVASNGKISRNLSQIAKSINDKQSKILNVLFMLGPILGLLFMIASLIVLFSGSIKIALILNILSLLSLNTYTIKYSSKSQIEQSAMGIPSFWRKFSSLMQILAFLNLGLLFYILKILFDSWWKPLLFAPVILFIFPILARNNLSQEYWQHSGRYSISKYAEENDIS